MTAYAELDLISNFSFLEGGSNAGELVTQAVALGLSAIGVADRNTLAGVVRAHRALNRLRVDEEQQHLWERAKAFRLLIGSRLVFQDGTELIVYPRDRVAYGRLCRLLTLGKSRIVSAVAEEGDRIAKDETRINFEDALPFAEGLIAIARAPDDLDAAFTNRLARWREAWPDDLYLAANLLRRGQDRSRLAHLARIAEASGAPMVAVNAVLYHHHDRRPLQDVLTCIREKTTIDEAGFRLQANAERYLKPPEEMARLFRGYEEALARTMEIADACRFSLDELKYHYPNEPIPCGKTANQHLRHLVFKGAREKFGDNPPTRVLRDIAKELRLIRKVDYPHYFLTVHDIVAWARSRPDEILCQGRGSAANSVVCFCLGITKVNPAEQDLLFERFLSEQRREPPDIDVDFEHERREEVMQYVYDRYGRHRAAIVATVIHYRPRSAIRDVGKALGLTEDVTAHLAGTVWGGYGKRIEDAHVAGAGLDRSADRLRMALDLAEDLVGFPRHLSQHVGGFVLTEGPLVETVPIGNAAMKDRTFIEWDKDDIDELKIMKVDVLALGMLTAIRKAFRLIEDHYGVKPDLAMTPDDADVYEMMCRADTIGVFQVESRAQMAMLPRLQPRNFYDLAVQVAIVRPGPIQGGMVHPYLRARAEQRAKGKAFKITYPPRAGADPNAPQELEGVLNKTLGVPIFQEQAMKLAMVAAEFSGDDANGLRRAMATFRHLGTMPKYERKMIDGMIARGYDPEFAKACFGQIQGFGEYGFPESHAISFALLVYVSGWIKHHYPDAFACALLNSMPMGFYAPAQIVRDAAEHGVPILHPDVNHSGWDNTLEGFEPGKRSLRLGLRQIGGFREDWAKAIETGRPFTSLDDLRTRAALPARALELLAGADALASIDLNRRGGLWAAKGLPARAPAPLFAACGIDEADGAPPAALPSMTPSQEVVGDYEAIRLSLKAHPVSFLRETIRRSGGVRCADIGSVRNHARTAVCGVVLVRQKPGSAKGVCFITLEDETGIANLVVWPKVFETFRPVIMGARMILARGRVQRSDEAEGAVTHLVVETLEDRSGDLMLLSDFELPEARLPSDGPRTASPSRRDDGETSPPIRHRHPRDVRVLPRSRDFH